MPILETCPSLEKIPPYKPPLRLQDCIPKWPQVKPASRADPSPCADAQPTGCSRTSFLLASIEGEGPHMPVCKAPCNSQVESEVNSGLGAWAWSQRLA